MVSMEIKWNPEDGCLRGTPLRGASEEAKTTEQGAECLLKEGWMREGRKILIP
jgi:hypothetical protein